MNGRRRGPQQLSSPSSSSSSSAASSTTRQEESPKAAAGQQRKRRRRRRRDPTSSTGQRTRITLTRYLEDIQKQRPELRDMVSLLSAIQMACKTISHLINTSGLSSSSSSWLGEGQQKQQRQREDCMDEEEDGRYTSMTRLDQLSALVLKNALRFTGKCSIVKPAASIDHEEPAQHQPGVLIARPTTTTTSTTTTTTTTTTSSSDTQQQQDDVHHDHPPPHHHDQFVACLDPLDGSGNADANICTGTLFGVYQHHRNEDRDTDTDAGLDDDDDTLLLQPARNMKAAGYCLYSSSTVFVLALGGGDAGGSGRSEESNPINSSGDNDDKGIVHGFTLDPRTNEFVLTHYNITIPKRGTVYSCNEANSPGWISDNNDNNDNIGWLRYLDAIKSGIGQTKRKYAMRYVGSMVADIHRTMLYGGIFAYPSNNLQHPYGNLQLMYKISPLSYVIHHANGKSITTTTTIDNGTTANTTSSLTSENDHNNIMNDEVQGRSGQTQQKLLIRDLLDIRPQRIHQKSPCYIGSPDDINELITYISCEEDMKDEMK